ncbi:MAG: MarR family winged helix-turn-helix transcriptional regulator [Paracoccaceae bacterium]|nr:MarR family winged helix-turn-helix transcriptional regulator [Paracoccaceae bacterium]
MTNAQHQPDTENEGPAPLPLHQFLTYRLSRVQAKLNAQATRILRATSGITLTQWRVIALVGAAGQTRLSELAKIAALDKGLLSRNLKTLIEDGVVAARTDDGDHRVQILALTAKGQAIFERTLPVTRARQQMLRDDLTEEELRVFRRVLDKLEIAAEK